MKRLLEQEKTVIDCIVEWLLFAAVTCEGQVGDELLPSHKIVNFDCMVTLKGEKTNQP